ncbi:MAG: glyoxalase/bleomycin resistance/extradiol dioxygenase family protein [Bacillota bacterium]|uniref:VOC family protein n=1 Tax=Anaerotruncus colihominis TaxID=169435 RepID=UPI000D79C1C4|nr:VOC family protein [Anaerotruncus colihominis]PWM75836.1 MAG: glyoxalase/bleomycin resistance/extradiol dioxygenase family protein [Bacillota bacterium]
MEQKISKLITGLQHLGLPVSDLDETAAFYEGGGFETEFAMMNEQAREWIAFLRRDGLTAEAYENKKTTQKAGDWDHLALDVTDKEASLRWLRMRQHGGIHHV